MPSLSGSFIGVGELPQLVAAQPVNFKTLRLEFNEPMLVDGDLTSVSTYTLVKLPEEDSIDILTVGATEGSRFVDLILTTGLFDQNEYRVEVSHDVKDEAGNSLDPSEDTIIFEAEGLSVDEEPGLEDFEAHLRERWMS